MTQNRRRLAYLGLALGYHCGDKHNKLFNVLRSLVTCYLRRVLQWTIACLNVTDLRHELFVRRINFGLPLISC